MEQTYKKRLGIDELEANRGMVSVHKYGFFLCRQGSARILLGSEIYRVFPNLLCIYTPNTFFQIIEKDDALAGLLEEDEVDTYYPVISLIDIRKRLQIRRSPCVEVTEAQAEAIVRLVEILRANEVSHPVDRATTAAEEQANFLHTEYVRHLRYALCLKVLEVYFCHTPIEAMPLSREDTILNRFLVSLHTHCHKERTVQFYADEQHLSPYYFSSIIKSKSGKSALQWIGSVTMTCCRQYLDCSTLSLKEIAERLNFPDQSTFGRYFKHHEGCSPSDFRAKKFNVTY